MTNSTFLIRNGSGLLGIFFWVGSSMITTGLLGFLYTAAPRCILVILILIGICINLTALGIKTYFIFIDPDRVRSEGYLLEKEKLKQGVSNTSSQLEVTDKTT